MGCEQKSGGFRFKWERALRESQELSAMAKLVMYTLASYADMDGGSCFPGQKRLAKECRKSVSTIGRALKEAEGAGFIERQRRQVGMNRTSDLYQLTLPGCGKASAEPVTHDVFKPSPVLTTEHVMGDRVPAQQEKTTQRDYPSNARARARGRGKAARSTKSPTASQRRFLLLWTSLMGLKEAPKAWALDGASYAQMTEALAWTLFQRSQLIGRGEDIRNVAGYFVSLLKAVVYGGEKTVRAWSLDDLGGLLGTGLSPDKYTAQASRA